METEGYGCGHVLSSYLSPGESDSSYFDAYFSDSPTRPSTTTWSYHSAKSSIDSTRSSLSSISQKSSFKEPRSRQQEQFFYEPSPKRTCRARATSSSGGDRHAPHTDHLAHNSGYNSPLLPSNDASKGPYYVNSSNIQTWLWTSSPTPCIISEHHTHSPVRALVPSLPHTYLCTSCRAVLSIFSPWWTIFRQFRRHLA